MNTIIFVLLLIISILTIILLIGISYSLYKRYKKHIIKEPENKSSEIITYAIIQGFTFIFFIGLIGFCWFIMLTM